MSLCEQIRAPSVIAVSFYLLSLGASISAAGVSSLDFSINSASAGHGRVTYQGLKEQPSRQDVHCGLARVYEVKGDHKLAIAEYRRYVEWARQVPITATNAAFRHEHAEIIEGTIRALESRVQRDEQK